MDIDRLIDRVNDPVFPDSGMMIFIQLKKHVLGAGRRRKNFHRQIRGPCYMPQSSVIIMADYEKVRLEHCAVVHIQLNITGRKVYITVSGVCIGTGPKLEIQFPQDRLMQGRRGSIS